MQSHNDAHSLPCCERIRLYLRLWWERNQRKKPLVGIRVTEVLSERPHVLANKRLFCCVIHSKHKSASVLLFRSVSVLLLLAHTSSRIKSGLANPAPGREKVSPRRRQVAHRESRRAFNIVNHDQSRISQLPKFVCLCYRGNDQTRAIIQKHRLPHSCLGIVPRLCG